MVLVYKVLECRVRLKAKYTSVGVNLVEVVWCKSFVLWLVKLYHRCILLCTGVHLSKMQAII